MIQLTEEQNKQLVRIRERARALKWQREKEDLLASTDIERAYENTINDLLNDIEYCASLLDSDSQAAEPDYRPNTMNTENEKAPKRIWINNPAEVTQHDQRWWYGNQMAFPTVEYVHIDLLATARKEAREAAFRDSFLILCADCAEGNKPVYDGKAQWYYHGEGRAKVGCSASKLRRAAAREAATTDTKENNDAPVPM